jgi:hypothetical protein
MDLKQRKLSKSEWESIEIPVPLIEQEILKLISDGYHNVNIKYNKHLSLLCFLKIEHSEPMEEYLYNKFFFENIKKWSNENSIDNVVNIKSNINIKKADQIRLAKIDMNIDLLKNTYEFIIMEQLEILFKMTSMNNKNWIYSYFTIYKLMQNSILRLNALFVKFVKSILDKYSDDVDILYIICNAVQYLEKNNYLLKYSDITLYDHQKDIFTISKNPGSKLILYIAPTGTGKTMTPLGLSEKKKIIFVCAARHVGLALARSAISIHKKIAFAFGCSSAEDVRLHYFAATDYTIDKRSGGIRKVDNSVGDKVEIIICDIKSYLPAMYYMLAFNDAQEIMTYWDEPTITLDYNEHEFHVIIKKNWSDNLIPNMVLSSATLPKLHELTETVSDFREKFPDSKVHNIVSHDCKKTIPMLNNKGYIVMPHYLSDEYEEIQRIGQHCEDNLTLLRYLDLGETCKFIQFIENNNYIKSSAKVNRNFGSLNDIDIKNIKIHYLKILKNILSGTWSSIYCHFKIERKKFILENDTIDAKGNKLKKTQSIGPGIGANSTIFNNKQSGSSLIRIQSEQVIINNSNNSNIKIIAENNNCAIYVTTKDAYTLTDGPTIFLANDVEKIAKFCIQQSNIPEIMMKDITDKIEFNNNLNTKIDELEKLIEDEMEKNANKTESNDGGQRKSNKDKKANMKISSEKMGKTKDKKVIQYQEQIEVCRSLIKNATLNEIFIPNKLSHKQKWTENLNCEKSFTSDIDDETIISIMLLKNVEDSWKILLLLGIGVFTTHESIAYTEIMKKLADEQKLYMIIASSDYIYGTNYQFCHGFLSKDLNLTQEKIIQAMGRIGRNNIQQTYTVRFRDDEQISKLFTSETEKPEIINMNRLFNSKNVVWRENEYVEVPEVDDKAVEVEEA